MFDEKFTYTTCWSIMRYSHIVIMYGRLQFKVSKRRLTINRTLRRGEHISPNFSIKLIITNFTYIID